jgi:hypothetical protein
MSMKTLFTLAAAAVVAVPLVAVAQTPDVEMGAGLNPKPEGPASLSTAPLTAFGVVDLAGNKLSGTPNWSSVFNSIAKRYEITIINEDFVFANYSTEVTPMGLTLSTFPAVNCKTDSVNGKLLVQCYDKNNVPKQSLFNFITHKYQ